MKITFLGTGTSQGIPIIGSTHPVCMSTDPRDKRLRVSILIEFEGANYVIDCGPDFRQQMLTHKVNHLEALLFTHEHADHTAGLDDIRPFFFRQGDIPVYAHKRVVAELKKRFDYIFETENRYPGAPAVAIHEVINNKLFTINKLEVEPINVMHGKLQVFGYRFGNFAYLTDVKTISEAEKAKLKNLDVLVVNALREEPHYSHFNLEEALAFVEEIKPKQTYFTHISHLLGFHAEVEARLPENIHLAYDGLQLEL
ncbi:phosphoribosyl 1,2-cyclic phosphate phosphodiesterase [Leeuwenhoekiella aestuarii]|uniref:Phosphoribosyl 1,2-cyclic phosphate phosphodiesterase n=1 Tax=Leeuwenhoekiella aestuarii TaxID=2249426 RepID=A0A4Q0NZT9_9FLAO|nr:MBL fold metallo-hydrolase [Leeuwenhoekiella aestuarii]RXG16169.1 phosphoribosyl 1,2-cyclic phosphate phosphodiesterase [Leeuwenhoekiella aestuarii]RXG16862.1 phosphoribosyl 1,2-cyclic phosphate phosphodiesterase [Leeuwenhoekiella aestuarii]